MAITLGLVEAIDSNGVYVSMPGSRGVLRGPYKSLSTVAAGTTVLVASTDDGEQVVVGTAPAGDGTVSVLSFGAKGDGVTDDTESIRAAATAAAGKVLLFPPDLTFKVTDSVVVGSGTTVIGYGATIRQDTKHKPCLDIVQGVGVKVYGLSFLTELTRTYTGGASVRGNDVYALWCGVTASGSRCTIRDCSFDGFTCGVYLTTWDGSALGGDCEDMTIADCAANDCDFGVLTLETHRCVIERIRGTWSRQSGSSNPAHLVYVAGAGGTSTELVVRDIEGWDSSDSYCVQVKSTTGAVLSRITSTNSAGVLSVADVIGAEIDSVQALDDITPTTGSLYMQGGCEDIRLRGVHIECFDPVTAARAGRIAGARVSATDLSSRFSWPAQQETSEWTIVGDTVALHGITSVNDTDYGSVVVGVDGSSTGVLVSGVAAVNCRSAVEFMGSSTGTLTINAADVTNGSSITSPAVYGIGAGAVQVLALTKPTVSGSRGSNAALQSLLTALDDMGLITDSSS